MVGNTKFKVRLIASLICLIVATASIPTQAQEAVVVVRKNGESIVIDVELTVAASVRNAWSVLTDYEHMSSFLTNLTSSKILQREGNNLLVLQTGHTKVAFATFVFEATRAVELSPMHVIRSQLRSGDFKAYTSTTNITDARPGAKIVHHGEYIPKAWLPPMIGEAIIEAETRKQYAEFAAEIARRESAVRP